MELKQIHKNEINYYHFAFNRTIMELKQYLHQRHREFRPTFNRTIMELKLNKIVGGHKLL